MDCIDRRVARLRALLRMGGTMENHGASLHLAGMRMDVRTISDMDEAVWEEVKCTLKDQLKSASMAVDGVNVHGHSML